jgi:hypothetical protein
MGMENRKVLPAANRLRGELPPNQHPCYRCNGARRYRGYVWGVGYHWFACSLCESEVA